MDNIILPIPESIPIKSFNDIASIGMVLLAEKDKYSPFYISNYLQLIYTGGKYTNDERLTFSNNIKFNDNHYFNNYTLINNHYNKEFCYKLFLQAINDGYYIWSRIDEYYIPLRSAYKNYHYLHGIFIYGYNYNNNVFYTAAYDETINYNLQIINNDDLLSSCINIHNNNPIYFFKPDSWTPQEFMLEKVKIDLNSYLNSTHPNNEKEPKKVYGINAVKHYIDELKKDFTDKNILDKRGFRIYWEHKEIIKLCLNYMWKNKIIDPYDLMEKSQYFCDQARIAFNLSIKHSINHSQETGLKAIICLNNLVDEEAYFIINILDRIENKGTHL
jgi:hypothetical protein